MDIARLVNNDPSHPIGLSVSDGAESPRLFSPAPSDMVRGSSPKQDEASAGAAAVSLPPSVSDSPPSQVETVTVPNGPDILGGQLVKTHFGGSGKHYEPIKPWRETIAALRSGAEPSTALHRTIAYNTSYLRTYFAKVEEQVEQHDPADTCM